MGLRAADAGRSISCGKHRLNVCACVFLLALERC
jgi:hypothetical protein